MLPAIFAVSREKLVDEIFDSLRPFMKLAQIDEEGAYRAWLDYVLTKEVSSETLREHMIESLIRVQYQTKDDVDKSLARLFKEPKHEQRSEEWYTFRRGIQSASNMYKVFQSDASRMSLIKEKVLPEVSHSFKGAPCLYGIKYEPMATRVYEDMIGSKVTEFGCIKHQEYRFIGASPDGIVIDEKNLAYHGRMLEIKCLYSRKMVGVPLNKYWIQMQIQLEACDLECCDYFECIFNEKLSREKYFNYLEQEKPKYYGIVVEMADGSYKYSDMSIDIQLLKEWLDNRIQETLDLDISLDKVSYWYLAQHSRNTVYRNREWFKSVISDIDEYWKDVLKYRTLYESNDKIFEKDEVKKPVKEAACTVLDEIELF